MIPKIIPDLDNARDIAAEYPNLKIIPFEKLALISVEDFVELGHDGERFKVQVKEIRGDIFIGIVRSDLVFDHPFEFMDWIQFDRCNIYDAFGIDAVITDLSKKTYRGVDL